MIIDSHLAARGTFASRESAIKKALLKLMRPDRVYSVTELKTLVGQSPPYSLTRVIMYLLLDGAVVRTGHNRFCRTM